MKRALGLALLGGVLTLTGCSRGPQLGQVEGDVRLNGKPLANVMVKFEPDVNQGAKGPSSWAITDDKGHYRLTCENKKEGAVVGWHKVVLEDLSVDRPTDREAAEGRPRKKPPRFPDEYSQSIKTPLKYEVKPGPQQIDLPVSDKVPGK